MLKPRLNLPESEILKIVIIIWMLFYHFWRKVICLSYPQGNRRFLVNETRDWWGRENFIWEFTRENWYKRYESKDVLAPILSRLSSPLAPKINLAWDPNRELSRGLALSIQVWSKKEIFPGRPKVKVSRQGPRGSANKKSTALIDHLIWPVTFLFKDCQPVILCVHSTDHKINSQTKR